MEPGDDRTVTGTHESADELPPTRVSAPMPSGDELRPLPSRDTAPLTIVTAGDALDEEERTRTRLLGLSGFVVNALGALALPLFGGTPLSRSLFVTGLVIHAVANFGLFYVSARPERFRARSLSVLWPASFVGLHLVTYFFGTLSVAAVAHVLGLYIVGISRHRRVASTSYAVIGVGTALMVALQWRGLLPDDGIVSLSALSGIQVLAMLVLLEAMFLAVYSISREARGRLAEALEQLRAVTREVAHREAVLDEARADFRRVAQIGGRGRFTGGELGGFRLENLLGRGGMGEIYEAVGPQGEDAAIKVLKQDAVHDDDALARFFRESRVAASMVSPHVVRVLQVGGPPADVPYIAMERLHGEDLASYLAERPRVPVSEVLRLVREVGRGITDASAAGVTHRDIKPQNVFRLEPELDGVRYKVLDFGVSTLSRGGGTLTRGAVIGTPGYMAPEQASSDPVDLRTDLYGLAAVAYRCLLGLPPFRGRDTAALLLDVTRRMPPKPSDVVPLDPAFDAVFAVALAKRPEERFGSAAAFADALEDAQHGVVKPALLDRASRLVARWPWSRGPQPRVPTAGPGVF